MSRRKLITFVATAGIVVGVGSASYWHSARLPKRFAPVVEGRLYRSGGVTPGQLERVQREYGIERVISLQDANAAVTRAERTMAEHLGIQWENVPLKGDGQSTPADRERILGLLSEPNAPPTLVHCSAGATRTGLAVGLYRVKCQNWSLDRALDDMRAHGFADLPKHEDVRQALAAEAAAVATSQPIP